MIGSVHASLTRRRSTMADEFLALRLKVVVESDFLSDFDHPFREDEDVARVMDQMHLRHTIRLTQARPYLA